MSRILTAATTFVLLSTAAARAETVSSPGMAEIMESLGVRLFSYGIVVGLAVFAALKIWRAIKGPRRQ